MENLRRDLEAGKIERVYVIAGDEELLKREAIGLIQAAVLKGQDRNFNLDKLNFKEAGADAIVGACRTYSMFGGRRLVIASGMEQMKAKQDGPLLEYLADPAPDATLILTGQSLDMRKKAFKLAAKAGVSLKLSAPYARQLPAWIQTRARIKGAAIEGSAAALLGDTIGTNLAALDEALERLILYVASNDGPARIRQQDVEASVARTREHTVFEIAEALGHRNTAEALRVLDAMIASKEEPIRILAMIARHFRRLWMAAEAMANGASQGDVAAQLKVHKFFLSDFCRQAGLFRSADYERLIEAIYRTDKLLKSSRAPNEMHMHALVLDICVG